MILVANLCGLYEVVAAVGASMAMLLMYAGLTLRTDLRRIEADISSSAAAPDSVWEALRSSGSISSWDSTSSSIAVAFASADRWERRWWITAPTAIRTMAMVASTPPATAPALDDPSDEPGDDDDKVPRLLSTTAGVVGVAVTGTASTSSSFSKDQSALELLNPASAASRLSGLISPTVLVQTSALSKLQPVPWVHDAATSVWVQSRAPALEHMASASENVMAAWQAVKPSAKLFDSAHGHVSPRFCQALNTPVFMSVSEQHRTACCTVSRAQWPAPTKRSARPGCTSWHDAGAALGAAEVVAVVVVAGTVTVGFGSVLRGGVACSFPGHRWQDSWQCSLMKSS